MARFKTVNFIANNDAGASDKFSVPIEIRASGMFYCHVPEKLRVSFKEDDIDLLERRRKGFFVTSASTFDELIKRIRNAHDEFMKPTTKEEPVICYNIESHVSFALTEDGRIFPNAGFPGAKWADSSDKTYGGHHAADRAPGGYSLIIGAKALIKTTTTYGTKSSVAYEPYYKGKSHLGHENPAQLLNSWTAIYLPDDAREMPYSDKAAMFFFGLLKSMAEMNRRVQELTNTPKKIQLAIAKHSDFLLLAATPPDKNGGK